MEILQTLTEMMKQSQNSVIIIFSWKFFVAKKYFRQMISTMSNGNFPTVPKITLRKPRGEPNYAQTPNLWKWVFFELSVTNSVTWSLRTETFASGLMYKHIMRVVV